MLMFLEKVSAILEISVENEAEQTNMENNTMFLHSIDINKKRLKKDVYCASQIGCQIV